MADSKQTGNSGDNFKGWLYKWTNYIKGYQRRWFVLSTGLISYYRTQAEMGHTCRGTINLANAFITTEDSCNFIISNGGSPSWHLRASTEVERQRWVTAMELAKAKAIRLLESDEDDDITTPDRTEIQNCVRILSSKLENLNTCNELIVKHGSALQRALGEFELLDTSQDPSNKVKSINERATLFRITSNAMVNACRDFLEISQSQSRRWQRALQYEHEQRLRLEETVETLAKQHNHLERVCQSGGLYLDQNSKLSSNTTTLCDKPSADDYSDEEDDNEFFDAIEHNNSTDIEFTTVAVQQSKSHRRTGSGTSLNSEGGTYDSSTDDDINDTQNKSAKKLDRNSSASSSSGSRSSSAKSNSASVGKMAPGSAVGVGGVTPSRVAVVARKRRCAIPLKPEMSINLWSIMKNCIGKELTKIPMPVNFNEPLSMLQRLSEDLEYSEILDRAAKLDSSVEQVAYVAAFNISAYAPTTTRTGKPFNPLLGETYECDRTDDFGWKYVAEQVSHHPPAAATYTQGRGWRLYQEFTMTSKFRGKYMQIIPQGIAHLTFDKTGNHYTWKKVTTTVHNIIVGKLWLDNHGEMDIYNHKTKDNCHLKFTPYSYFSRESPRKVTGIVTDANNTVRWVVSGSWDHKIETAKVIHEKTDEMTGKKPIYQTLPSKVLWQRNYPPPSAEKMYHFTQLAIQLNEREELVAPTDSRHRPDQRLMEEGLWNEANMAKIRLEDKQRIKRREREAEALAAQAEGKPYIGWEPVWFRKEHEPLTNSNLYSYTHKYWQCKETQEWQNSPDIY